jgi:hypothetical protein
MGALQKALEADLPAEDVVVVAASRAAGGVGAGCSGKACWGRMVGVAGVVGLLTGVVTREEPLSKNNFLRPTRWVDSD